MEMIPKENGGRAGSDARAAERGPVVTRLSRATATEDTRTRNPEDLKGGDVVDGQVRNLTEFAAFIDVGVGSDAFLHVSKWGGRRFHVNEHVSVRIKEVRKAGPKKWKIDVELNQ